MVGINLSAADPGVLEGVGLAVPATRILEVLPRLEVGEDVNWIGLDVEAVHPDDAEESGVEHGLFVWSVQPASAGDGAGVRPGDVLLAFDGLPLGDDGTVDRFYRALGSADLAAPHRMEVVRDGVVWTGELNGKTLTASGSYTPPPASSDAGSSPGLAQPPTATCTNGGLMAGMLGAEGIESLVCS